MFNRKLIKTMAREQMRGNIGPLLLCFLVYSVLAAASVVTIVGPILIAPPLYLGLLMIFLGLTRGEKPQVAKMFEGFQIFGKSVVLWFVMNFFIFLWSLLLVVPGIIKMFSYMFAPYILIENPDMSAMEALSASKDMTNGHKMELFMLVLSFTPWMIIGMFTLGIGYIYALPYYQSSITNAYNYIKNGGISHLAAEAAEQ